MSLGCGCADHDPLFVDRPEVMADPAAEILGVLDHSHRNMCPSARVRCMYLDLITVLADDGGLADNALGGGPELAAHYAKALGYFADEEFARRTVERKRAERRHLRAMKSP